MSSRSLIIDDSTPDSFFNIPDGHSGYEGMFRSQSSAEALTVPMPRDWIIPRSEWQGMIQERAERKTRTKDLMLQCGMRAKNQATTNLCWAFAPTMMLQIMRARQGQPYVSLSPASVAGPINGFRNQGGWGEDALVQLRAFGAVPTQYWGDIDINSRLWNSTNKQIAMSYRADEYFRLTPRNLDEHISLLLHGIPCAVGLNYWGHEVLDVDPVWENGQIGVEFINSWDVTWGEDGYGKRQGNRILADDNVAILSTVAS